MNDEIYVQGVGPSVREMIAYLGGPSVVCIKLKTNYPALKEWYVRNPIPLGTFLKLISLCDLSFQNKIKLQVNAADFFLGSMYSSVKIRFPKKITADMAYLIGLLLGDGSLAGDSSNERGDWRVSIFFDNTLHQSLVDDLF
ncbi:MAG: hypothetical protein HY917_04510, partial [Candidatus Diapherotrites archaeon]|nr:hypothetical protein [Candidatus Diapherotrites archaeon]